jgi:hypothetical protein
MAMSEKPPAKRSKIFISYRRDDTSGSAGRLYDNLQARFGPDRLFMDVDAIRAGDDFVKIINEAVKASAVVLAVIGRQWLRAGSKRARRLDDPHDFVRLEIVAALENEITLIPVLVDSAGMPRPQDVPEAMADLTRRQAVELSHAHWHRDVERLMRELERIAGPAKKPDQPTNVQTTPSETGAVSQPGAAASIEPLLRKLLERGASTSSPFIGQKYQSSLFSSEPTPYMKELAVRREAEKKRRAEARVRLPRFYKHPVWWISLIVNFAACVWCALLADALVGWTAFQFGKQLPPISSYVAVYGICGLVWALAYSAVATAYYVEDPESAPLVFFTRGLFGGWPLAFNNFELGAGLAGAFPLSLVVGWALARVVGVAVTYLIPANHSGVTYVVFGIYTGAALWWYVLTALDERDTVY